MQHIRIIALFLVLAYSTGWGQTLAGVVLDAETQKPLNGANVILEGTPPRTTISNTEGQFEFKNIKPSTYQLHVSYIGYQSYKKSIVIEQDQTLTILLQPAAVPLDEVLVLSSRARDRETPAAFSTLTRNDIENRYAAQDIPMLLSELPSIKAYSETGHGVGYTYLSIRGFDQRRISVLINGVPQNDPEDHNVYWVDLPDLVANVEDIQVQRGAGSAFYGPPAIGGSINIITSHFKVKPKLTVQTGFGSYETQRHSLALNSGRIKDRYILHGRISQIKSDGYRDQSWVDFKSYFLGIQRLGERTTARLQFYGGPIEDHLAYSGISKADAKDQDLRKQNPIQRPDEIENFNQPHLDFIHEFRVNDRLKINNTIFGIWGYGFFDYDGSWAPMSYFRLTPEYGFDIQDPENTYVDSLLIRAYVDNQQYGWYPQVTLKQDWGGIVSGAEFRTHRSLHWGRIQKGDSELPRAISGDYQGLNYVGSRRYYEYKGGKDIISPFFRLNYYVRPNINLMVDLQYVYLKYKLYDEKFIGTDFDLTYHFLNPRIGINYNIDDQLSTFVSFSRTSREPRLKNFYDAAEASTPESWGAVVPQFEVNSDGSYNFDEPLVNPEVLNDYEWGLSYRKERLFASVNLFYMDFQDEIIKSGQLDRFGQPVTGNAEQTVHAGIELAATLPLHETLTLSGNFTYSQNELKKYTVYDSDETEIDLAGNPIAGFPDILGNARVTYSNFGLTASLKMQHVGKQYTDNFKNEENTVDPYTVFDLNLNYQVPVEPLTGLSVKMHINNLFDELYISHGEGDSFFPAAERNFFVGMSYELTGSR